MAGKLCGKGLHSPSHAALCNLSGMCLRDSVSRLIVTIHYHNETAFCLKCHLNNFLVFLNTFVQFVISGI